MNVKINHIRYCTKINQFLEDKKKKKKGTDQKNPPHEQLNSAYKFSLLGKESK